MPLNTKANRHNKILPVALCVAAMVHLFIILGVGFEAHSEQYIPPSLEVLLVKEANKEDPDTTNYLAQHSQQGGGASEQRKKPTAPISGNAPADANGDATRAVAESAPRKQQTRETEVLTQIISDHSALDNDQKQQVTDTSTAKESLKRQRQKEMARLTREIADALERQASRPRTMYVTASTKKAIAANYMLNWVQQVERIGNLNFPVHSIGTGGSLVLVAGINRQGLVTNTRVIRSSGSQTLDNAAINIVKLAQPFPPMSPELARETDIIYITRTWQFNADRSLRTR